MQKYQPDHWQNLNRSLFSALYMEKVVISLAISLIVIVAALQIVGSLTSVIAHQRTNTLSLEDPEIFKYPLLYIIEVSWWRITDAEARNLRAFLDKGGFVIVDDFKTAEWRGGRAVGSCPHGPGRPASPDMQIIIRSGTYPLVIGSGP
jgi:hypothetical protein